MCGLNVIIATLPAGHIYGTGSAGALASQVKKFFPSLWFGLLVGVAAGLPDHSRSPPRDIRLGDVLVALPRGETAGLVAYDLGKETETGFQLLSLSHALVNAAPNYFLRYYEAMKNEEYEIEGYETTTFSDPGQDHDDLNGMVNGIEGWLRRPSRSPSKRTRVWYGAIGSGEKLVKSRRIRDELRDQYTIIGLEMDQATAINQPPPTLVSAVEAFKILVLGNSQLGGNMNIH
ncbi:Pfs, NACHT and WD domain protein [Rostrohypoxylon terebratum]|nr:Pfs, NACHT and WD domain protein [Rostrohypoxylon terebratum]